MECPSPQPGQKFIPINLKIHTEKWGSVAGGIKANKVRETIQNDNSKYFLNTNGKLL